MKRFQFPLERVREYRRLQMEAEQARMEECQARLRAVEEMIEELARQKTEAEQSARNGTVDGADLGRLAGFHDYARRMASLLAGRRREALDRIARQRAALVEARRRFEVLNRSKDHAQGAWIRSFDREQEALASELYLGRWRAPP